MLALEVFTCVFEEKLKCETLVLVVDRVAPNPRHHDVRRGIVEVGFRDTRRVSRRAIRREVEHWPHTCLAKLIRA